MSYKNQYTRTRWKTPDGVRTSVGLPTYLFNLLLLKLGSVQAVNGWVKEKAISYSGSTSTSTRSHWIEQQAVLMLLGVVTC